MVQTEQTLLAYYLTLPRPITGLGLKMERAISGIVKALKKQLLLSWMKNQVTFLTQAGAIQKTVLMKTGILTERPQQEGEASSRNSASQTSALER